MLNSTRLQCAHFLSQSKKHQKTRNTSSKVRRRAFLESLEPRTVLTAPGENPWDYLPGVGASDHPTALLSDEGYLVVRTAQGSEFNNELLVRNDDGARNLVITDQLLPFVDVSEIPGATLSADKHTLTIPWTSIGGQKIFAFGGGGDDTLTVDIAHGKPIPSGGFTFVGGGQMSLTGDAIELQGGAVANADYVFFNENDGSISLDGKLLTYYGLEPIVDNLPATDRTYTYSGGVETITITDEPGVGLTRIDSTLAESVVFLTPTNSLTIITNGGDTINMTAFDPAFNTPTISLQGTTSTNTYNLTASNVIPDVSNLSLTGNAAFNLNGFSETVASLASTNATPTVTLSAGQTLTVNGTTNTTFSGVISGAGNLAKAGTSILALSGANTFTGTIAITGGAISVAADNNLGAVPGAVVANAITLDGGALNFTAAATFTMNANRGVTLGAGGGTFHTPTVQIGVTYPGTISGAFPFSKTGPGDVIFNTAAITHQFSTLTIVGGRIFYNSQSNLAGAGTPITIKNGGTLDLQTATTIANNITVESGGNIASRVALTLSGIITLPTSGTIYFNLDDATTGVITMNNAANVIAATGDLTFQIGLDGFGTGQAYNTVTASTIGNVVLNHLISGNVNVTKTAGGVLVLNNAGNTFGGAGKTITILGGAVSVGADAHLGDLNNTITFSNPRRAAISVGVDAAGAQIANAQNTQNKQFDLATGNANFSDLFLGTFTTTVAGDYTFGLQSDDGSSIFIDLNNDGIFTAPAERVVTKANGGVVTPAPVGVANLAAASTYRIAIAHYQGTGGGSLEAKWGPGNIATYLTLPNIVNPAAQPTVWSSLYGAGTLEERVYAGAPIAAFADDITTFPGLLAQPPLPTGRLAVTAAFTTARNFILNAQGGFDTTANLTTTGTFSTPLTFLGLNGGITKTNTGTMILGNNANTYTGPTVLRGGVLQATVLGDAGANSALGNTTSAAGNLVFDGGALQYNGAAATTTNRNFTITLAGGTLENSSAAATSTLSFTTTTPPLLIGNGARTFALGGSNTGNNTFITPLTDGGGATSLNKTGTGLWILNNPTSTYTGTVSAGSGYSTTANAHGILRIAASNMIPDAASLQMNGGTFDIQAFTETVTNYRHLGFGTLTGTTGVITSTNSPDLRSGYITGGKIVSANPFIKSGAAGFDVLSPNALTGNMQVNGGSLNFGQVGVANSATQTLGTVSIDNSAALNVFSSGAITSGAVSIANLGTFRGDVGAGNTATWTTTSVANDGGNITVSSGTLDFGNTSVIANTTPAPSLANTLDVRLIEGRLSNNGPTAVNTDAGIASALAGVVTDRLFSNAAINIANDAAFGTFFGNTSIGNDNSQFTTLWVGTFTVTTAGVHQFNVPTHDDGTAVWLDLNNNGVFESGSGELVVNATGTAAASNLNYNIPTVGTYRFAIIQEDTGGGSSLRVQFAEPPLTTAGVAPAVWNDITPSLAAQAGKWNALPGAGIGTPTFNIYPGATLGAGSVTGAPAVNITNLGLQERVYRAPTAGPNFGANNVANAASVAPNNTLEATTAPLSLLNVTPLTVFNTSSAFNNGLVTPGAGLLNQRSGGAVAISGEQYGHVIQGFLTVGGPNFPAGMNSWGLGSDDAGSLFIDTNSNGLFEVAERIASTANTSVVSTLDLPAGTYRWAAAMQETTGGEFFAVKFGIGTGFASFVAVPNIVDPTSPTQAGMWTLPGTGPGKLMLNSAAATTSALGAITVSGLSPLGAVDFGANNTVNAPTLDVGAGGTFTRSGGAGTFNVTTGQTYGTAAILNFNAGTTVLQGPGTGTGAISVNNANTTLRVTNATATSTSSAVTVATGGRYDAAATNTRLGNVTIAAASFLRLSSPMDTGAGATLPAAAIPGTLEINNTAVGAAYDGIQMATGSTVTSTIAGATYASDLSIAGTVSFDSSGAGGSFTVSGVISGAGGLTKIGAGTLTLTGTNTYAGATTVTTGTLAVNGSITSAPTVQTGATLTGSGTTALTTINAGGTHAVGNGIGISTVNGNYVENGALQIQIATAAGSVAGTDYDQLRIIGNGSVTIGAAATLVVTYTGTPGTFNPAVGQVYTIIDNDGTAAADTAGTFATLPAGATVTVDGRPMQIQYNGGDGNNVVLVAQAPVVTALYVNDQFTAANGTVVDGDLESAGVQSATIGTTAFASIAAALAFNPAYVGVIVVNGGTYASALLTGGGAVTLRLVQDLAAAPVEPNVTISSLSGDATDAIATRFNAVANANLIVEAGSFAGVISGAGDVIKANTGTVTLTGANTYTGATIINGGILSVGDVANNGTASHLGQGTSVTISGNSVLQFTGAAADATNRTINIAASAGANSPRIEVTNAAGDLQLTGAIAGAGQILGKLGAGALSLETGSTTTIGTLFYAGGVGNIRGTASVTATQIAVGASPSFILGGGSGTLNVQGTATVSTGTIHLGENNGGAAQTNAINQSGGTVTVTANSGENAGIRLGHWPNETSTYNLSGGTLALTDATADIAIATDGTGTFNQTGGTLNVPGIMVDHRNATGVAALSITGGTSTIGARGLRVSDSTAASIAGTANVTAGSIAIGEFVNSSLTIGGTAAVNVTGAVTLGTAAAISGDLTITSTGVVTFGALRVGRGTATINGASVTSTGVSTVGSNRSDEIPGMTTGSSATGILNISAGSFTALGIVMGNADGGTVVGTINQTGGTVTTTGDAGEGNGLRMGHWPTGTANYNLSNGTLNVNGGFALSTATDGTGIFTQTGGTANVTQLDLNSRVAAAGNGTFTLNGGTFNVGSGGIVTDGGGGPYTANLGGGILRATANWTSALNFNLTNAVGAAIVDTNGFNIGLSGVLSGTGGLIKNTGLGNLTLSGVNTYTGATNVNAGTLQLQGGSAILDTAGAVSVGLGATLQLLTNETISSYVGAGDIGAGTNDSTLNLGALTLTTTGSAALGNVTTAAGGTIVAGTAITDADDDNNVTGPNVVLQAATGIGTAANPVETTVANLEASGGTGGVFLANTGDLIIGGVSAMVGVSATGAGIAVSTVGQLTINENVAGTGAGTSVTLSTIDAATTGQNLILPASVTVSSAAAGVTLNAGDDATLAGSITSGTATTVIVDATNADALGGTFGLTGTITAPGGAFINGDTNDDTFTLRPQSGAVVTVDGKAPFLTPTGDVLNLDLSTAVNPQLTLAGIGGGTWTFNAPLQTVNYISIEVMNANASYHLALDANTTPFGNTGVADTVVLRQSGANLVVERTGAATAPDNDDIGVIFQGAIASILSFTYVGSSDADTLSISDVGGLPQFAGTVPSIPDNLNLAGIGSVLFDGNGGSDNLSFNLTGANAVVSYAIGNGAGAAGTEGEIRVASGAQALQAYFVDAELAERTGKGATPGALLIIGDSAANSIAFTASGSNTLAVAPGYTNFSFTGNNFSALTIDGLSNGDTLELIGLGSGQTNGAAVNLVGNVGDDTLRVHSTSGQTGPVTLIGSAGNDTFVLQSATNTVDGIVAPITVDGTDGLVASNDDRLTIVDTGDATGDSVLVSAVNAGSSADYRVDGITSTAGNDVVFRNIDTLTYTGTQGNDVIDAQFVSTSPMHDLSVVTLNGWTGGDQFLLFTSDQIGGTAPTPTGAASGLAVINLNGDAPGNPNGTDGNDIFGQTPPGVVGTGAGNAGLIVPDTIRLIRPSVSTGININGGQPTAPVGTSGDIAGDVLNLDITSLPSSAGLILPTAAGVLASAGLQPLTYAQIEDLNVVSGGELLNLQMGDTLVRGTSGPDTVIFSQINVTGNPNNTRVRLNTTFVDFPMSGKTLTFAGDSNDYLTHSNVTFPMESHGEGGDDYIAGGTGNDMLVGGLGSDQINASSGNNIVIGDQMLSGTSLPQDSVVGGDDVLSALGGNDVFYGGGGNDYVSPGPGNDYLYGGEGDDVLDGNLGDDRIYGGNGNDILSGSAGNDLLSGGAGADMLLGLDGNDVLIGGGGADTLDGGNGDDLIITGSVANELSSWTSAPNTTTFDANLYSRPTDNDQALLLLLAQWSSTGNRSGLAAVINDNATDIALGGTGNDDFSAGVGEAADFNQSGMGSDEMF